MHQSRHSMGPGKAVKITVLALGWLVSANALAALDAYLTLEGATQGEIEGSSSVTPHEGKIAVIGYSHKNGEGPAWQDCKVGVSSHEPLVIIKERDRSTPDLYEAYAAGESFVVFRLEFYEPTVEGTEGHTFTIELTNARIIGIDQVMLNNKVPENMPFRVQEHVSFVYDAIQRTFEETGAVAMDTWQTNCGK